MPISYITLILMKLLKEREKKTIISLEQLSKVISEFLAELPEEQEEVLLEGKDLSEDRDYETFSYELNAMINKYSNDIFQFENFIILNPNIEMDKLDDLINSEVIQYFEYIIEQVNEFVKNRKTAIFKIIGINVNEELYDNIMSLEENIEDDYEELAKQELSKENISSEKILSNLKINIFKRNLLTYYLKENCSIREYKDLCHLFMNKADSLSCDALKLLKLKIKSRKINNDLQSNPFLRALFIVDTNRELAFAKYLSSNIEKKDKTEEISKQRYYKRVIDIIDRKVNKKEYDSIYDSLTVAKYGLMYVMDLLYRKESISDYLFMGGNIKEDTLDEDYSFAEDIVFYFINEVLEYTDMEVSKNDNKDFENTIKSILIEAYYELTKDERVIETIKNNLNYGKYHFITGLFDNIINKNKTKIKRKEE